MTSDPRDSNRLLSMLIDQALDYGVLLLDTEGMITWANPGAEKILGASAKALVGQPLAIMFFPNEVERGDADHEIELARREGTSEDDRWQKRVDGSAFWATGQMYALREEDGTLAGFGKIFRNRTDMKEMLDTLANRGDASKVAAEHKDLYLATLAHELRSPLTPLRNAAELLRRGAPNDPKLAIPVGMIERQVATLHRLVEDLSDLTRIGSGKMSLELGPVVVQEVLERAVDSVRPLAIQRRNRLETLMLPTPVTVHGDPTRLLQIFVNLLTNAVKYTPEGGTIWLKFTVEAEEAVIRVVDDGIGIAPEMLARIFDVFTQMEPARSGGGLGLGLALVKELVTLHEGSVQAVSDGVGQGSQFTVRLPVLAAPP